MKSINEISKINSLATLMIRIKKLILEWWEQNRREFPWRKIKNPWKIFLASFFLRKTTATVVSKHFENIVKKFSSPEKVLAMKLNEIEEAIKPLGMYRVRAKQLREASEVIIQEYEGKVPQEISKLMRIPGIGRYSAALILSVAYGKYMPIVDINVERVIKRILNALTLKAIDIEEIIAEVVKGRDVLKFSFALMDLAGMICRKSKPKCDICPLNGVCKWWKSKSLKA